MPRANRYILPGYIYHLTHRCHDRKFLLKFRKDRDGYRRRLRQAVRKYDLSLLSYNITSNHVHLIAFSDYVEHLGGDDCQGPGKAPGEVDRELGSRE